MFWNAKGNYLEPLRSHRWYLQLTNAGFDKIRFALKECKKPEFDVNVTEHKILNHVVKLPGILKWKPINIKFASIRGDQYQLDASSVIFKAVQAGGYSSITSYLQDALSKTNMHNALEKGALNIIQVDPDGNDVEVWSLFNAIITGVNFGNLNYESEDIVNIECTINYDYAILNEESRLTSNKTGRDIAGNHNKEYSGSQAVSASAVYGRSDFIPDEFYHPIDLAETNVYGTKTKVGIAPPAPDLEYDNIPPDKFDKAIKRVTARDANDLSRLIKISSADNRARSQDTTGEYKEFKESTAEEFGLIFEDVTGSQVDLAQKEAEELSALLRANERAMQKREKEKAAIAATEDERKQKEYEEAEADRAAAEAEKKAADTKKAEEQKASDAALANSSAAKGVIIVEDIPSPAIPPKEEDAPASPTAASATALQPAPVDTDTLYNESDELWFADVPTDEEINEAFGVDDEDGGTAISSPAVGTDGADPGVDVEGNRQWLERTSEEPARDPFAGPEYEPPSAGFADGAAGPPQSLRIPADTPSTEAVATAPAEETPTVLTSPQSAQDTTPVVNQTDNSALPEGDYYVDVFGNIVETASSAPEEKPAETNQSSETSAAGEYDTSFSSALKDQSTDYVSTDGRTGVTDTTPLGPETPKADEWRQMEADAAARASEASAKAAAEAAKESLGINLDLGGINSGNATTDAFSGPGGGSVSSEDLLGGSGPRDSSGVNAGINIGSTSSRAGNSGNDDFIGGSSTINIPVSREDTPSSNMTKNEGTITSFMNSDYYVAPNEKDGRYLATLESSSKEKLEERRRVLKDYEAKLSKEYSTIVSKPTYEGGGWEAAEPTKKIRDQARSLVEDVNRALSKKPKED